MADFKMSNGNLQAVMKRIKGALGTRIEILSDFCGVSDCFEQIMNTMTLRLYAQLVSVQLLTLKTSELNTVKFIQACVGVQTMIKEGIQYFKGIGSL